MIDNPRPWWLPEGGDSTSVMSAYDATTGVQFTGGYSCCTFQRVEPPQPPPLPIHAVVIWDRVLEGEELTTLHAAFCRRDYDTIRKSGPAKLITESDLEAADD